MSVLILMPALSPTMTEGNLVRWNKQKGDAVKAGDVLAEIETDKATMEVEAVDGGVLGAILVPAGTGDVKVNTPIAVLLEEGEGDAALEKALASLTPDAGGGAAPEGPAPGESADFKETGQGAFVSSAPPSGSPAGIPSSESDMSSGRMASSPLARRLAAHHQVSLQHIKGSGPKGRIVKQDVLDALQNPLSEASLGVPARAPSAAPCEARSEPRPESNPLFSGFEPPFQELPVSMMRKVIARRLSESKQTVPHFYVSTQVLIDGLLEMRQAFNASQETKISVNDIVILAVAKALKRFPEVNVAWAGDGIRLFERVDIAVAVSLPDGLITPVIRGADSKGLATISAEMKQLAARAREGKLRPEEFQGGTFSLSNLGMFGVEQFTAIVNPPQAAILAVGAGIPKAVVKAGQLGVGTSMNLTLSLDHRAIDGALGAQFLEEVKRLLEQPARMLL